MRKFTKFATGAAAAALVTTGFAATPAQAQYRYNRDRGIDAGDILTGVAVIGGIAAIASAIGRDGNRYGYTNRYQYRDDYTNAVNACGYEAERYGRGGRISVTDVDRRGNGYRVRGVVDAGYNNGYGYDPYGAGRYGYDNGRYSGYNRYAQQVGFSCSTDRYGRIRDFDVNRARF